MFFWCSTVQLVNTLVKWFFDKRNRNETLFKRYWVKFGSWKKIMDYVHDALKLLKMSIILNNSKASVKLWLTCVEYFLVILLALIIGSAVNLVSNELLEIRPSFNYNPAFMYCNSLNSLDRLWPDWTNNGQFIQCMSIGWMALHCCPQGLFFGWKEQVCVWPHQVSKTLISCDFWNLNL